MMTANGLPEQEWDAEFEQARRTLVAHAWADAARLFEQYVIKNPDLAPAWANLSLAYRGLGDTARQLTAARRANELDPNSHSASWVLVEALLASGLYARALTRALRAQKLFPKDMLFAEVAAKAHEGLRQPGKAIAAAQRAIRYSPFFNIIMHGLVAENLMRLGRLHEAIREYDRIIHDDSPIPGTVGGDPKQSALSGKATDLLLMAIKKRTDSAWHDTRVAGQAALEGNPRDGRTLAVIGVAHRHLAEFELSLDYLERAI